MEVGVEPSTSPHPATEGRVDPRQETVLLLHGLARSKWSMWPLEQALRRRGYATVNVDYPSRRFALDGLVDHLRSRLARERPPPGRSARLNGVGYSLGGIVLIALAGTLPGPWRPGRLVTIGSPHRGARVADVVAGWGFARSLLGPILDDLGWESRALRSLADRAEGLEIGAIAGERTRPIGAGALINARLGLKGATDGTVEIMAALGAPWLPPFSDRIRLRAGHLILPAHPAVIRESLHFLEHGRFSRRGQAPEPAPGDLYSPP